MSINRKKRPATKSSARKPAADSVVAGQTAPSAAQPRDTAPTGHGAAEPAPAAAPLRPPEPAGEPVHKIRFKLFGVGGAGCNTVGYIARSRAQRRHLLSTLDLAAVNTDLQALHGVDAPERIQIGGAVTHGLGAGGDPEIGARAAQHDAERLLAALQGVDVVFIVAGLGGGTGTGAAALLARLAKQQDALVLAIVSLPFGFEGDRRRQLALSGLETLKPHADAVIVIHNDKLFKIVGEQATAVEAFARCDEIIATGAQAVWQLLARKGLINLDFADLRATLGSRHCEGLFSHGEAEGPNRAHDAVKALLDNPLFDGHETLARAESVLISILGGPDLTLADVQKTVDPISRLARRAHLIMGAAVDDDFTGKLAVTIIAAATVLPKKTIPQPVPAVTGRSTMPAAIIGRRQPATPLAPAAATPATAPAPATVAPPKQPVKPKQETLPLEGASRGRFDKTEPTLYDGEDLDIPTFLRRGINLKR
jgi:cell division protein FtsZ